MSIQQINPILAFEFLKSHKSSILVDVRTIEEFKFVGIVDAQSFDNRMLLLPLQILPDMQINPDFQQELTSKINLDQEIFFICRSGFRSNKACEIAQELGYKKCYNIVNGFEGDLNSQNQRSLLNGWKSSKLPWRQQ